MTDSKIAAVRPANVTGIGDMSRKMAAAYFVDAATFLAEDNVEVDWLIPGMIPRGNVILLSGEPGGGKSWVSYELGRAVCTATPWLGRGPVCPEGPQTVLFLNYDNPTETLRTRLKKLGFTADMPFHVHTLGHTKPNVPNAPSILTIPAEAGRLKYALEFLKPALVVFDSFRQGQTLDENNSKDMAIVMNILKSWTAINRTSVLVLHHTGKGDTTKQQWVSGARGSGEIIGSADVVIKVEPNKLEWTKTRPWKMGNVKSATFEIVDNFADDVVDKSLSNDQTRIIRMVEKVIVRATAALPGESEALFVAKIIAYMSTKDVGKITSMKELVTNVELKEEQVKEGIRYARQKHAIEYVRGPKTSGYRLKVRAVKVVQPV